jgi:predicted transcriptional regulator
MQPGELSEDVQQLLREHIESFEQLGLLLLLHDERDLCWTQEALSSRLGLPDSLVLEGLDGLRSAGFVESATENNRAGYRYCVQHQRLETTIARLAQAYKEQPMPVIKLMTANAIERMRTAAVRTFADAFIVRKENKDG